MNEKKKKIIANTKEIVKKKQESLPPCKGLREFLLEKEVKSWSGGENEILISVHEIKRKLFSVKVGVKLNSQIVKTACKIHEDVGSTIEELCFDLHVLLSQLDPYNHHFHCEMHFI